MTVLLGDCREILKTLDANSVDCVCTDPPYFLSFMSREWDTSRDWKETIHWHRAWLREAYRVMKPGAALFAFAGTRTCDLLTIAARLAGFEIKDTITYLYWITGSGFPKAQDLGALIDKARKEDEKPIRAVCRFIRSAMDANKLKSRHMVGSFHGCHPRLIDHWAARDTDSQPALPQWEQWLKLKALLDLGDEMDAEVWRLNGRKGKPGDDWAEREVVGKHDTDMGGLGGERLGKSNGNITIPATDLAREWDGWKVGGLKPAYEPILFARKPCEGSTTANVLRYGVGGFNADACRVTTGDSYTVNTFDDGAKPFGNGAGHEYTSRQETGRFPPNLLLDDEAAAMLDEAGREMGAHSAGKPGLAAGGKVYAENPNERSLYTQNRTVMRHDEGDDVSRFFPRFRYTAKACRWEREAGLERESLPKRRFASGGRTQVDGKWVETHSEPIPMMNIHATVKPILLIRWLIELVTREGQTVLDPLCGSGTTCAAARWLGREAIGIEKEPEYHAIAVARENWWAKQRGRTYDACQRQWEAESAETPLFKEAKNQ